MRKILFGFLFLLGPLCVSAANIKMITFFPVPYASYSNLDVSKKLDVGVMSCAMNLSCPDNNYALSVYEDGASGSSVLKKGYLRVTAGKLDLNAAASTAKAVTNTMTVGAWSGTGGELKFKESLRIGTQMNAGQSLQAVNEGNTVTALALFPGSITNNFPACEGVEGAPEVSWQRLEIGASNNQAANDVFLVCGKPKSGTSTETCTMKSVNVGGGNYSISEIAQNDTCNGNMTGFSGQLKKGESCLDYIQTGSCSSGSLTGKWEAYRGNYNLSYGDPNFSSLKNGGQYSNCLYTVQNKVWGSGTYDWYGDDKATELCKLQCPGMSHNEPNCNTNPCQFIWGCSTSNAGGTWTCMQHKLKCTADTTSKCPITIYKRTCE